MRKQITLLLLLLLSSSAMAQAPEDLKPLAARTFTRSFNEGNVSLEYTLRAGPLMEPGKRRFIEIDIDTLMRADAVSRGEFAIPLNGFIAIALPRGIEPDGELRMKFYNGSTGRYDFMYSSSYPAAVLSEGLESHAADAVSSNVSQILSGLEGLSSGLDQSISFSGPQDSRLLGGNPDYAITGSSWLIPCNSLFEELVDPFAPAKSLDFNPRLKATLPVRIGESVANPRIMIYVGSLSSAVSEGVVMSDAIPANARLLETPPVAEDAAAVNDGTEESASDVQDGETSDEETVEEVAIPAAVPLRALVYSYGWAAWESEIDLSPVIIDTAIAADYSPVAPDLLDSPVNLDPPPGTGSGPITITAADSSEKLDSTTGDTETEEPVLDNETDMDSTEDAADAETEDVIPAEETADVPESADIENPADPAATDEEELPADPEESIGDAVEDIEPVNPDGTEGTDSNEEVVPGSLAELKDAVEERRDRESGNSVNIDLPAHATETTAAEDAQQAAALVNENQDSQLGTEPDEPVVDVPDDDADELPVRDDIPPFAFPEEVEATEEDDQSNEGSSASEELAATDPDAEFREVEPGTLPGQQDMYSVPLKQITGRDGRQNQSGNAPDYTQLYIGGTSPGAAGSTTPGDMGEMVFVPGGPFTMGTDAKASAGDEDERPIHEVELDDFYIDKYPVTNRQYYQFVLSDGYKPQGNWQKYFEPGTADMPVRGVSWEDANAYCRWAGKRLPTEAEWEKAARGEDGRLYPWGDDWSSEILPRGSLNYRLVLNQKAASPYGALAMVGVLWQWTASSWAPYPYDPDANGSVKVLRGGAFSNGRNIIRCANRYPEDASVGFNTFTFRCARDKN